MMVSFKFGPEKRIRSRVKISFSLKPSGLDLDSGLGFYLKCSVNLTLFRLGLWLRSTLGLE